MPHHHRRARGAAREEETAGHRHARLQHILTVELELMFSAELSDPRLEAVQLTAIELSLDCRNIRVHYVHPKPAEVAQALSRALPFIRAVIGERLSIKRVPELRFAVDPRMEGAGVAG